MQAFYPKARVFGAKTGCALVLGWLLAPWAQATSAGYRGPVELHIKQGALCVHIEFDAPPNLRYGWALELRLGRDGPVMWGRDINNDRGPKPPTSAATCLVIDGVNWQPGQAYRAEFSTYESYRSDFCWQPASAANPSPRLLDVDPRNGQCTDLPWVGGDGDALTLRGTWHGLILWWRDLFKP